MATLNITNFFEYAEYNLNADYVCESIEDYIFSYDKEHFKFKEDKEAYDKIQFEIYKDFNSVDGVTDVLVKRITIKGDLYETVEWKLFHLNELKAQLVSFIEERINMFVWD